MEEYPTVGFLLNDTEEKEGGGAAAEEEGVGGVGVLSLVNH